MSTKRRIGVSAATTEAARRQLMQPVQCWEKVWSTPENGPAHLKVFRWVKSEKTQQFSDDEDEVDEPLVPLPDEPEIIDGEDEDQEEEKEAPPDNAEIAEVPETLAVPDIQEDAEVSKPPSPKPNLSLSVDGPADLDDVVPDDALVTLDASLQPLETGLMEQDLEANVDLDMDALGPDGLQLENGSDLTQLQPTDALVGGPAMDQSLDPFAANAEQDS